jgi:all-trans-retinol 13,14-reductase
MSEHYDAIIIGSGIGGMTVGSLLSQVAGKRVLLLERHFKMGGLTHTFRRQDFEWDVGLHYVGGMQTGSMSRQFMDAVTSGKVQWNRIAEPYDRFIFPDFEFAMPDGKNQFLTQLKQQFPHESQAIDHYFRNLHQVARWAGRTFAAKTMPKFLQYLMVAWGKRKSCRTTGEVLRKSFQDEKLKAILAAQWGNYGLPPEQSAFAIHSMIAEHYFDGAYYPVDGSGGIADSVKEVLGKHGGTCLVNHAVQELVIHNRRVAEVRVEHKGKQLSFTAPQIISAIGAKATYQQLIPQSVPLPERELLNGKHVPPATAVTLFVGLREDPRKHGFGPGNLWMFDSLDHDAMHSKRSESLQGVVHQCFLSFPSLRTPDPKTHTAELITFTDYESWRPWSEQPWLKRDAEYQRVKDALANAMVSFVERYRPGFKDLIAYQELATPLTVSSMTGHAQGAIYGFPATPDRYRRDAFPIQTSIKNLCLTGCDVGSLGIVGAMMGGVMTTSRLLGPAGFPRLLKFARSVSPG